MFILQLHDTANNDSEASSSFRQCPEIEERREWTIWYWCCFHYCNCLL